MLPDRVSNPGPQTYKSGALPIALRGPAHHHPIFKVTRYPRHIVATPCHTLLYLKTFIYGYMVYVYMVYMDIWYMCIYSVYGYMVYVYMVYMDLWYMDIWYMDIWNVGFDCINF